MSERRVGVAIAVAVGLLCALLALNACKKDQPQFGAAAYIKDTLTLPYNVDIDEDLNVDGNVIVDGTASVKGNVGFDGDLEVDNLTVTGNETMSDGYLINTKGAVTVTDNLALTGNIFNTKGSVTVTDNLYINGGGLGMTGSTQTSGLYSLGEVEAGTFLMIDATDWVTVTDYLTPTASFMTVTSDAWVTPTLLAASCDSGTILVIYSGSSNNITWADTGDLLLAGDFVQTAQDTLMLINLSGLFWVELGRTAN